GALEEARLGRAVRFHRAVIGQQVAGEVRVDRGVYAYAVEPPLDERVRARLHRDGAETAFARFAQAPVQRDRVGRRVLRGPQGPRRTEAERAEVARGTSAARERLREHESPGG